jgi:hypothetical protein
MDGEDAYSVGTGEGGIALFRAILGGVEYPVT